MTLSPNPQRIALVTGANRGLGFETSRQLARLGYRVIMAARDAAKVGEAVDRLRTEKLDVKPWVIDVASDASVAKAGEQIQGEFGRLDALVNNAGILPDEDEGASALKVPSQVVMETFNTNTLGAYRMIQAFAPLMIRTTSQPQALCRIVNVSSGMGQLSEMNGGYPAYRVSKTALNALTRIFSEEFEPQGILVNSICPGWVKTDMGGEGATLTPSQGADTIVWAATLPPDSPSGGFFRNRERIEW